MRAVESVVAGWFGGSSLPQPQPLRVELSRFRRLHRAGS